MIPARRGGWGTPAGQAGTLEPGAEDGPDGLLAFLAMFVVAAAAAVAVTGEREQDTWISLPAPPCSRPANRSFAKQLGTV